MEEVIIGSTALKHWYGDLFNRSPKDLDIAVRAPKKNTPGVEYLENPILFKWIDEHPMSTAKYGGKHYLVPNLLLTLKASHLFWDINWEKHMFDCQFLIEKGYSINIPLFYELYDYWNEYHGKNKRSDLKMTADDFFNNAIESEIPHDDIHLLINPVPIYTKILKDGAEVEVCEEKFNKLSFEDKVELVREEIYCMAYERYKKLGWRHAFNKMLKKFIIGHAPLFESLFIISNYKYLQKCPYNFIKLIDEKLK